VRTALTLGILVAGLMLLGERQVLANPDGTSAIQVKIQRGLLTVDLRDAPLAEVLRAIGERAGLKVAIDGDASSLVTKSFAGVPLEEGIKRLVGGAPLVFKYATSPGETAAVALSEVWIYVRSAGDQKVTGAEVTEQPGVATSENWVDQALLRPEPGTRLDAVRELARQPEEATVGVLGQIVSWDEDPIVRREAAAALGRIGGAEAAAALTPALSDQEPAVRMQAVRAVGRIGDDGGAQALGAVSIGDPDPLVRRLAVRALGAQEIAESRSALEAATSDPNESVRREAASALSRWQERSVAPR
jgi:hypothetical protein